MQLFWHTGAKLSFISKAVVLTIQHESEAIWQKNLTSFWWSPRCIPRSDRKLKSESWEITRPWWAISWVQNNRLSVKSVSTIQHQSEAVWQNKILPLFDEVPDAFHESTGNSNRRLGNNNALVSYFVYGKIQDHVSISRRLLTKLFLSCFFPDGPWVGHTWWILNSLKKHSRPFLQSV